MLLDSNILIYAAEPEYDYVRQFIIKQKPIISVISKVEVRGYHKLTLKNQQKLEKLFQIIPLLPITDTIVEQAIILRQTRKMSLGYSFIASTVLTHNLTLDINDFNCIENLTLINPIAT